MNHYLTVGALILGLALTINAHAQISNPNAYLADSTPLSDRPNPLKPPEGQSKKAPKKENKNRPQNQTSPDKPNPPHEEDITIPPKFPEGTSNDSKPVVYTPWSSSEPRHMQIQKIFYVEPQKTESATPIKASSCASEKKCIAKNPTTKVSELKPEASDELVYLETPIGIIEARWLVKEWRRWTSLYLTSHHKIAVKDGDVPILAAIF